jgi:hypothetical protein
VWRTNRVAASGRLAGRFIDITASETVLALHPRFKARALAYDLQYFDAAASKSGEHRLLTQVWETKSKAPEQWAESNSWAG